MFFSGMLPTAIAAPHCGRKSITIEKDSVCFGLAVGSLQWIGLLVFEQFGSSHLPIQQSICGKRVQSCVIEGADGTF